jgi:hypothetical protein
MYKVTGGTTGWEDFEATLKAEKIPNDPDVPNQGSLILDWDLGTAAGETFIKNELDYLLQLREDERDRYMPEISGQADGAPGYFMSFLGIEQGERPFTTALIAVALRAGEAVAMSFKLKYKRIRPSMLAPGLLVPFGPPAHASFPSGHATQCMLVALALKRIKFVDDHYGDQLVWLARRMAKGRERAGLHYPSDSYCGFKLAGLTDDKIKLYKSSEVDILGEAKKEWP